MSSDLPNKTQLFKSVRYHLIGSLDEKVKKKLVEGQAKAESYLTTNVTHAFFTNNDKLTAEEADDVFQIPVISARWVELSYHCNKLLPTTAFEAFKPAIFRNLVISFSQFTKNDKEILWGLITANGGRCQSKLNSKCTHLIAAFPKGKKYEEGLKHADSLKILTPDWIIASVKEKVLKDTEAYKTELVIIPESPKPKIVVKAEVNEKIEKATEHTKSLSVSGGRSSDTSSTGGVLLATVTITKPTPVQNSSTTIFANSLATSSTSTSGSSGAISRPEGPVSSVGITLPQALNLKHQQQLQRQISNNHAALKQQQQHSSVASLQKQQIQINKDQQQSQMMQIQKRQQMVSSNQMILQSSQGMLMAPQYTASTIVGQNNLQHQIASSSGMPVTINVQNSGQNSIKMNISSQAIDNQQQKMIMQSSNQQQQQLTIMSPQGAVNVIQQPNQQQMQQVPNQQQQQQQRQNNYMPSLQQQLMYGNPQQPQMISQQQNQQQQMQGSFGNQQVSMQQPHQNQGGFSMQQQQQRQMVHQQHQQQMQQLQVQQQQQKQGSIQQHQLIQQQPAILVNSQQQQQQQQMQQQHGQPQQVMNSGGDASKFRTQIYGNAMMTHNSSDPQQQQSFQQQSMATSGSGITRGPTPSSLKAAGMAGISPSALQQGLRLNAAQMKSDQPPLVHPSLQGELFPKSSSTADRNANQKKKSRSRKKTTDASSTNPDEVAAPKPKPKPRTNNRKKSTKAGTNVTAQMNQMYNTASTSSRPSVVHHMASGTPTFSFQPTQQQQDVSQQNQQQQQFFPSNYPQQQQQQMMQQQQARQKQTIHPQHPQFKHMTLQQQQQQSQQPMMQQQQQQQQMIHAGNVSFKQITPQQQQQPAQVYRSKSTSSAVANSGGNGGPPPNKVARTASVSVASSSSSSSSGNSGGSVVTSGGGRRASANKANAMRDTVVRAQQELIKSKRVEEKKRDEARREQSLGKFVDPLAIGVQQMMGEYQTRDTSDKVPSELCLLGCIFVIDEYQDILPPTESKGLFTTVIPKFGGVLIEKEKILEGENYTHLICASQKSTLYQKAVGEGKRCATVYWLHDVLFNRHVRAPWLAIHLPTPYPWTNRPASKHVVCTSGFHQKERTLVKSMLHVAGATFTSCLNRTATILICKRPIGAKHKKAREWNIACVTTVWLRDIISSEVPTPAKPDDAYLKLQDVDCTERGFLLDFPRVKQALEPWKVSIRISEETLQKAFVRRFVVQVPPRQTLQQQQQMGSDTQVSVYRPLPRMIFTGFTPFETSEMKKKVAGLSGCRFIDRPDLCTHLIAKTVLRTQKFLSCICTSSFILTQKWIDDSVARGQFVDEADYELNDWKTEERLKFSLKESLRRAKNKRVFQNCMFFLTPKVQPDHNTLRVILSCGEGLVIDKLPTVADLKHLQSRTNANRNDRYYVVSCAADQEIYMPMKKEGVIVHHAEIILTSALKQQVDDEMYRL